jgi:molecular chaperone IbpA|tara:strand:- start:597 stop:974 length:378 start_codon:yes stop_codon:yes gene_type:complete
MEFPPNQQNQGFPPYNIRKLDEENFTIELALAGLDEDDVEIEVKEGVLTVRSVWDEKKDADEQHQLLHRGISFKKFTRSFTLADDLNVDGASFKNGLLTIGLERIIPEHKKAKKIKIGKKEYLKG